jgi:hypothetical protein
VWWDGIPFVETRGGRAGRKLRRFSMGVGAHTLNF